MAKLKINVVLGHRGRFEALFDGRVQAEGLEMNASVTPYNDLFRIVPEDDDFDVAELSVTGYLWGLSHGRDWIAIPVFPGWAFAAHADTVCHVGSGIESPQHQECAGRTFAGAPGRRPSGGDRFGRRAAAFGGA